MRVLLAALLLATCLVLTACGEDETSDIPDGGEATSAGQEPTETTAAGAEDACQNKETKGAALAEGKDYSVDVTTSEGAFTIALDPEKGPRTARSFVDLAKKGFFDDTEFHRIVPDFVIQGGDPTNSGTGGPGYSTCDTPPPDTKYTKGVVAMAKSAQEEPGTAGSQFYVVTGDASQLPAEYAVLGEVSKGLATAEKIGKLGDPATEKPTKKVVIEKTEVVEE
ncbi:MAG: peptidylprolyl isomerase [Thermoleophilaceae bacterium]|nr:peptidylprolyl isomerase [Thermoleophilaceae bacterium]